MASDNIWYNDPNTKAIIKGIVEEEGIPETLVIEVLTSYFDSAEAALRNGYDHATIIKFGKFIKRGTALREKKNKD